MSKMARPHILLLSDFLESIHSGFQPNTLQLVKEHSFTEKLFFFQDAKESIGKNSAWVWGFLPLSSTDGFCPSVEGQEK